MSAIFKDGGYQITVKSTTTRKVIAQIYIGGVQVTVPVVSLGLQVNPRAQIDQSIGGKLYVSSAAGDTCSGTLRIIDSAIKGCDSSSTAAYGGLLDIMKLRKNKNITNRSVRIVIVDPNSPSNKAIDFSGIINNIGVSVQQNGESKETVSMVTLDLLGGLNE